MACSVGEQEVDGVILDRSPWTTWEDTLLDVLPLQVLFSCHGPWLVASGKESHKSADPQSKIGLDFDMVALPLGAVGYCFPVELIK